MNWWGGGCLFEGGAYFIFQNFSLNISLSLFQVNKNIIVTLNSKSGFLCLLAEYKSVCVIHKLHFIQLFIFLNSIIIHCVDTDKVLPSLQD